MQATLSPPLAPYPVRVEGHLDHPGRAFWLLKWVLVIPHFLVLAFLWMGFLISALCAFAVIVFTGRYPRSLFDFNLGVMRWSWRVSFYAFGANGTDRYPPFTLEDVPGYPARLEVDYPERQRTGLALIGWWFAGIPQYVIAGALIGGGGAGWTAWSHSWGGVTWFGLIGLLVLVSVLVLLFHGEYPHSIFDFVLGLNRWVLRAVAYATVMTPEYPPFRIDIGEDEPSGMLALSPAGPAAPDFQSSPERTTATRWGAGRLSGLIALGFIGVCGLASTVAGGAAILLDQTQRDSSGYLMTPGTRYSTTTYAVVSDSYRAGTSADLFVPRDLLGTVKVRVRSSQPVFVGIGRQAAVDRYFGGVAHAEGTGFTAHDALKSHPGGSPASRPGAQRFWSASATGAGRQTVSWTPQPGDWRIVLMNANGSPGVSAEVSVGARFPHLLAIGIAVLGAGILVSLLCAIGVYLLARKR